MKRNIEIEDSNLTDKDGCTIELYDVVEVSDPAHNDNWEHSFEGTICGFQK
jgi:hypothetical protein